MSILSKKSILTLIYNYTHIHTYILTLIYNYTLTTKVKTRSCEESEQNQNKKAPLFLKQKENTLLPVNYEISYKKKKNTFGGKKRLEDFNI